MDGNDEHADSANDNDHNDGTYIICNACVRHEALDAKLSSRLWQSITG